MVTLESHVQACVRSSVIAQATKKASTFVIWPSVTPARPDLTLLGCTTPTSCSDSENRCRLSLSLIAIVTFNTTPWRFIFFSAGRDKNCGRNVGSAHDYDNPSQLSSAPYATTKMGSSR
ncbi:hypothetical protein FRC03_000622 [Tulasnella sp. 419]|nr:hypothetical protein FRC03_000622 [Tulasnella sp. 419]